MKLIVSGKISDDIFDASYDVLSKFKTALELSGISEIKTGLDGFLFFPVIISDDFDIENKNHRSYSRKENAEFVNVEIPYNTWIKSDKQTQFALLTSALKTAVQDTMIKKIDDHSKNIILIKLDSLIYI